MSAFMIAVVTFNFSACYMVEILNAILTLSAATNVTAAVYKSGLRLHESYSLQISKHGEHSNLFPRVRFYYTFLEFISIK